jgi:electron transport complex protein RnfG
MNEVIKVGGKLAAICAIAAIALGIANAVTEPIIIAARAARLKAALEELSLGLEIGELVEIDDDQSITGYYALTQTDSTTAYIIKVTGKGYAGDMNILTAISLDGEVLSAVLMENTETPGLGKEAENPSYMEMYIGTGKDSAIPFRKTQLSLKDADSVTGASITFIGIGKALNEAAAFVDQIGGM